MTKVLSIIGTRPQYIKMKPIYDYAIHRINHVVLDTNQHFDKSMSSDLVDEFDLKIDYKLGVPSCNPIGFVAESMIKIQDIISKEKPDIVNVIGDTNSTFVGAFVANKMGIKVSHIESGIRCGDRSMPEEINRLMVDSLSDIHFVSRKEDCKNVPNPTWIGDLEYSLLNSMDIPVSSDLGFVLMTIHRKENLNKESIKILFDGCRKSGSYFKLPIHHSFRNLLINNHIPVPDNIEVIDPQPYGNMVELLSSCSYVVSDSGGVIKILPFFGKRGLVPMGSKVWEDVFSAGYAKQSYDIPGNEGWLSSPIDPNRGFYHNEHACELIIDRWKKCI